MLSTPHFRDREDASLSKKTTSIQTTKGKERKLISYGCDGNNDDDGISNTKRKAISICGAIGADQNVNVEEVQHHFFDFLTAFFFGCSVEVAAGRWAEAVDDDVDDDCFIMMRSNAACHLAGLKVFLVSGSPRIDDDSQCWIVELPSTRASCIAAIDTRCVRDR